MTYSTDISGAISEKVVMRHSFWETCSKLLQLPIELLESISLELDVCSLWNLLDTCTSCRYPLLASHRIWQRLIFNLDCGLSAVYAALRRFRDSNGLGLRLLVKEVVMDGTDDSMISPIVMMVKFPRMQKLSAKHRRFNTNLEADTKILQELMKRGSLEENSLALEQLDIYHYYMDQEPHLDVYQKTLNRLSQHGKVSLDVRRCKEWNGERSRRSIDIPQQQEEEILEQLDDLNIHRDNNYCHKVISTTATCWKCDYEFKRCWHCVTHCTQCRSVRLPPLANDNSRKQLKLRSQQDEDTSMDQDLKEQFSLFE
ncbi:uncharacterized protein BX664DRAFT_389676 [Halteromyces radiatus]|uniref:uncharacterized protein n=1 Tax=Halteromyces radiatus TaxID=101107 RepID=UPI00221E488B|nr:uncharacterized protein BX664DRAFT_389676 [Halteromyces radiatus]KAI8076349.1 hypothetical protein BX664DRAFT_389676 [Halteromyces radiatus]